MNSKVPRSVWICAGLLAGLAVGVFAADAKPVPTTAAEAPRIEAAELKKLVEKGQAVVVDVRAKDAWDAGHIEGAVHIPLGDLASRLKELPKDKAVVAYCT
jgi:predicted sulfurtransferase